MLEKLRELGIRDDLIREITEYRETYPVEQEYGSRIPKLEQFYYGKEVWEQAITAILCGENILLADPKSNGKESVCRESGGSICKTTVGCVVSCEYGCSFIDWYGYIPWGEVSFRPGPVYTAAKPVDLP